MALHDKFAPTKAFALERELAGCSRASLMLILPASAIPDEWVADAGSVAANRALAEDELTRLNGQRTNYQEAR